MLADTLIPGSSMCGERFELKIDDHVFIGHPVALEWRYCAGEDGAGSRQQTSTVYNVVIIVRAGVSREGIKSYHKLAQQFATARETEPSYRNRFPVILLIAFAHPHVRPMLSTRAPHDLMARTLR